MIRFFDFPENAPGNEFVKMKRMEACPVLNNPVDPITIDTPINIEFEFWNCVTDKEINLSLHLFTNTEECVFASATELKKIPVGLQKTICEIPANLLNDGIYQVSIMIVCDSAPLYNFENMVSFEINEKRQASGWHGKWPGIIRPKLNFKFINE